MYAILLRKGDDLMVAWVIYKDLAQLKQTWAAAGWTWIGEKLLDNPWPQVYMNVCYVGQHPQDPRSFRF